MSERLPVESSEPGGGRRQTARPVQCGPFRIEARIGKGSHARVYRARHVENDQLVALKILSPDHVERSPIAVKRFHREATLAARLLHPNVVTVYASGEQPEGFHWIALELITGPTLLHVLAAEGPLPPARVLDAAIQLARALACAEKHGILHRDVKPDNVLCAPDGVLKLADFGLARQGEGHGSLTRSRVLLGTPRYVAPEAVTDPKGVDRRADYYSLGMTLHHLASGRVPLEDDKSAMMTLMRHTHEDVPRLSVAVPAIGSGLDAVVARLTERRRERRYPSAAQIVDDLEAVAEGLAPPHASIAAGLGAADAGSRPDSGEQRAREMAEVSRLLDDAGESSSGAPEPESPPGLGRLVLAAAVALVLGLVAAAVVYRVVVGAE